MTDLIKTVELAYIVGVYLGDGCAVFSAKYGNYYFALNACDEDFVNLTSRCLSSVLGKDVPMFEDVWHRKSGRTPLYKTVAYGKKFANWLRETSGNKRKVPSWIKRSSVRFQRAFVAGVMDSEGSVWISNTRKEGKVIRQQTQLAVYTGESWLKDFCRILSKLGVKLLSRTSARWNGSRQDVHRQNMNVESFIKSKCYFTIQRKYKKLSDFNQCHSFFRDYQIDAKLTALAKI